MAGVVDTPDLNSAISHMTEDARKFILVISPYLRVNQRLRRSFEVADAKGVRTFFVYGKEEMDVDTYDWIRSLKNSSVSFLREVHAKVFLIEVAGIVMSMNIYRYSQENNEELGVIIEKRDRSMFKDLVFHSVRMIDLSEKKYGKWEDDCIRKLIGGLFGNLIPQKNEEKPRYDEVPEDVIEPEAPATVTEKKPETTAEAPELCHCIRCNRPIPPVHPYLYCGRCLDSWSRYKNFSYVEQTGHCYICGAENKSRADRPACLKCYSLNKDFILHQCDTMRKQILDNH